MKKLIICALALPLLLGTFACKKDKNTTTNGTAGSTYVPSNNAMAAKIDGTTFPVGSTGVSSSNGTSNIYIASPGLDSAIIINVSNNTAPGTYNLSSSGLPNLSFDAASALFYGSSGSIVISSNDTVHKLMKGTFAGTVTSNSSGASHSITGGTFTMNYQ